MYVEFCELESSVTVLTDGVLLRLSASATRSTNHTTHPSYCQISSRLQKQMHLKVTIRHKHITMVPDHGNLILSTHNRCSVEDSTVTNIYINDKNAYRIDHLILVFDIIHRL